MSSFPALFVLVFFGFVTVFTFYYTTKLFGKECAMCFTEAYVGLERCFLLVIFVLRRTWSCGPVIHIKSCEGT